ncbi:type IV pilus modification PilV family protein [Desulforegula conservatrix]|uniref:type IV pilus modification PilV family protein n=1 Tax=Desulforegula conservatrix TaxID=153026 RepID=UPI000488CEEB|nr:type II secretion system protein [Desulforegula conservatrix]
MKADFSNPLKNSQGFTLMEILVAVMLLAISLTIIMQQFSGGIRNITLTDSYSKAINHARNLMEEALSEPKLLEGTQSGTIDDEFRWTRTMTFIPPVKGKKDSVVKELEIAVRVEWTFLGMVRDYELVTIKAAIN